MPDRCIGFSGTPSSLLPLELGECIYQKGDDARMLKALTDPTVVSRHELDGLWSVASLLQSVSEMRPTPHALIDAGALVTGMSNEEVADHLLPRLPADFEGVVYLEQVRHATPPPTHPRRVPAVSLARSHLLLIPISESICYPSRAASHHMRHPITCGIPSHAAYLTQPVPSRAGGAQADPLA